MTITATVPGGVSTGQVTFLYQDYFYAFNQAFDRNDQLATVPVTNGVATYTSSHFVGVLRLTAIYRDANTAADSPDLDLVVNLPTVCH